MAAAKQVKTTASDSVTWDKHASIYEKVVEPMTWLWGRDALTLAGYHVNFIDKLPSSKTYLEVACGSGQLAITAATMGFQVTATDISIGMLERLEAKIRANRISNIEVKIIDGQTLEGITDSSFDVVMSNFGVCHFSGALEAAFRDLRPGGQVIMTSFESGSNNFKMIQYILTYAITKEDKSPRELHTCSHTNSDRAVNQTNQTTFQEKFTKCGYTNVQVHSITHGFTLEQVVNWWKPF